WDGHQCTAFPCQTPPPASAIPSTTIGSPSTTIGSSSTTIGSSSTTIGSPSTTIGSSSTTIGSSSTIGSSTTVALCSLATSAFHGGGVGAGGLGGARTGATHTDTTAVTTTATTVPVMDTAIAVGLGWPSYNAGLRALAITMAPSMESWGLRLGERFGATSATMDT